MTHRFFMSVILSMQPIVWQWDSGFHRHPSQTPTVKTLHEKVMGHPVCDEVEPAKKQWAKANNVWFEESESYGGQLVRWRGWMSPLIPNWRCIELHWVVWRTMHIHVYIHMSLACVHACKNGKRKNFSTHACTYIFHATCWERMCVCLSDIHKAAFEMSSCHFLSFCDQSSTCRTFVEYRKCLKILITWLTLLCGFHY